MTVSINQQEARAPAGVQGGMKTKLKAAELATKQGIDTIITNGKNPAALCEILGGGCAKTLFSGKLRPFEQEVNKTKFSAQDPDLVANFPRSGSQV